ncbi:hypothetical protein IAT38_005836 [Cryptococcus sp. DSM 104549]
MSHRPNHQHNGQSSRQNSRPTQRDDDYDLPPTYQEAQNSSTRGSQNTGSDYDANFTSDGPGLHSRATINRKGTINVWVDCKKPLPELPPDYARPVKEFAVDRRDGAECPPLRIVIFIVGSRGDVQPYLALALNLIISNSHRVRIATHTEFQSFSLEGYLTFFDVGGDPRELMAYMVKNPGLMPGMASLTNGDIPSKRRMTRHMMDGFYRSTYSPDPLTGAPFAADAIISNPPAFAHVHIAEALGMPLQLTFTMPWSPTTAFSHPLVNIKQSNAEQGMTNYLSFALAEMLQWQGLGAGINKFRNRTLGLKDLNMVSGPSIVDRLKVPWTYCWSDGLIPKPADWKEHIDISGFYFMPEDNNYKPSYELAEFLQSGPPPIYIGFGSVVVEDPAKMTDAIFEAVKITGVRALVSAGWGGLGEGEMEVPEGVHILRGNVPHDWLFAEGRVYAVCHHGGAGTTAIGLKNGLPTIVVPFFGDQPFWGQTIHRAGAGPPPIKQKLLTPETLADAIHFCMNPATRAAAQKMARQIRSEYGEGKGVTSFHKHLPLLNMRCDLMPSHVAIWWCQSVAMRLSGAAAAVLVERGILDWDDLELHRAKEYAVKKGVADPTMGGASSVLSTVTNQNPGGMDALYNPTKESINTAVAGIRGVVDGISAVSRSLDTMSSSMDNVPARIGSVTYRQRGPVRGFASGVKEGWKGLYYGVADGMVGIFKEPIEGAQTDGVGGFFKGIGRSYVNVVVKPLAGASGFITLPFQGLVKTIRPPPPEGLTSPNRPSIVFRQPRRAISTEAAQHLLPYDRDLLVEKFMGICSLEDVQRRIAEIDRQLEGGAESVHHAHGSASPQYPSGMEGQGDWKGHAEGDWKGHAEGDWKEDYKGETSYPPGSHAGPSTGQWEPPRRRYEERAQEKWERQQRLGTHTDV